MAHPGAPDPTPGAVPTDLLAAKAGQRVVVLVPARNEEGTVGQVVRTVAQAHLAAFGGSGLVDDLVVVDDGSSDGTARVASDAGATVVRGDDRPGKGQALRRGLAETAGDLVVFLDADVVDTTGGFVTELLRPLLLRPGTSLVKGFYARPLDGSPTGGGRVTELVARPILQLLFPELAAIRQPLAGETATWRTVVDKLVLDDDYGVEMGLLIDAAALFGASSIAQADLGVRTHRNRSLAELRPQAEQVLAAALRRAGVPANPDAARRSGPPLPSSHGT